MRSFTHDSNPGFPIAEGSSWLCPRIPAVSSVQIDILREPVPASVELLTKARDGGSRNRDYVPLALEALLCLPLLPMRKF